MNEEEDTGKSIGQLRDEGWSLTRQLMNDTGFEVPSIGGPPKNTKGFVISQRQFQQYVMALLDGNPDVIAAAASGIPRKAIVAYTAKGSKDINSDHNTHYAIFVRVTAQAAALSAMWLVHRNNWAIRSGNIKAIQYSLKHQGGYEAEPIVGELDKEKQADLLDDIMASFPTETSDVV